MNTTPLSAIHGMLCDHYVLYSLMNSWDGVVGTVSCYGLKSQGVESWWGDIFCVAQTGPTPIQLPVKWVLCLYRGKVRKTWC